MRTIVLALVLALTPALVLSQSASAAQSRRAASELGWGVLTIGTDIFYMPAKVIYALGGTAVGSVAWVLSGRNRSVFRAITQPALRGDYVLTPENLRGERTWRFMGRDPELGPYSY